MAAVKAPLEGIRVLDLGRHQAGPRCAQVLARLGAEVIKVERLEGEETRSHGPYSNGQSAYWVQYNSGKKSLAIDLRRDEAKDILRELVKVSDVLVQNFRPGTIEKMGFGYDTLKELNPASSWSTSPPTVSSAPIAIRLATIPSVRPCRAS